VDDIQEHIGMMLKKIRMAAQKFGDLLDGK
jgi:hypothetical protein